MLRIAFVDHHLNNWHADTFAKLLAEGGALHGEAEIAAAWESTPGGDSDWCEKFGVPRAASIAEAVRAADAVMLLAPDNIDVHAAFAADVLPAGKPAFLDKLLAPTVAEARAIAELARRHGAPLYSASALAHAVELAPAREALGPAPAAEAVARGMGKWPHYGMHTLALATALMGHGIARVIDTGTPTARTVTLDYGAGRRALVDCRAAANEWDVFGWSFAARAEDAEKYVAGTVKDFAGFYENQLRAVLAFFRTGEPPAAPEALVETVAVVDAADRSLAAGGEWVTVAS